MWAYLLNSWECDVTAPHFFHQHGELFPVSCPKCLQIDTKLTSRERAFQTFLQAVLWRPGSSVLVAVGRLNSFSPCTPWYFRLAWERVTCKPCKTLTCLWRATQKCSSHYKDAILNKLSIVRRWTGFKEVGGDSRSGNRWTSNWKWVTYQKN